LAVLIPLIVLAWGRRKQWPGLAAALVAYAVTVFPVLGVAQSGPQFVADRYSYHSCLGIAVLGGWLMLWPWRAKNRPTRSWPAVSVSLAALVVVVFLGVAAYRQTRVWQNSLSLWEHAVKVTPHSSVAHANYATALAREKRFNDALPHYERALQIDPNDFVAWHHMGDLYLSTGRPREAIESYRRTLVLAPSRRGVHLILGDLLIGQGKYEEALVVLRDGAKRNPTAYDLFDYLADFLATFPDPSLRNGDEAVYWASKSSDGRGQQSARGLLTLATAFAEAGQLDEAVKTAEKALSLATAESNQKLAADLQHRLQLFRSGRPYHYGD
jgi:tetratricopeptide (TPR) repeat protein